MGYYLHEEDNLCRICERGTYQDELYRTSCKSCPDETTTVGDGATREIDCSGWLHFLHIDIYSYTLMCTLDEIKHSKRQDLPIVHGLVKKNPLLSWSSFEAIMCQLRGTGNRFAIVNNVVLMKWGLSRVPRNTPGIVLIQKFRLQSPG